MTKKFQTIALTALLFNKEKTIEDKNHKPQKRSYCVRSWLQRKKEKGLLTQFFKKCFPV